MSINSVNTKDPFFDSRLATSSLPLTTDTINHIFSYLSVLDLQTGLTTNCFWYATSVKVISTRHVAWLQGLMKCLKDQTSNSEWESCVPTEDQFWKGKLTDVILTSKYKFLEKLKSFPPKQQQELALSACCHGYLDLSHLCHSIVDEIALNYPNSRFGNMQVSAKEQYVVLSDQDLCSALSTKHFEWLKAYAYNTTLQAEHSIPENESILTIAMNVFLLKKGPQKYSNRGNGLFSLSVDENESKEKCQTISNELITASKKITKDISAVASIKSRALQALAAQLQTPFGGSGFISLFSTTAKTCHTLTQVFFEDLFFLAKIYQTIDPMTFNREQEFADQWQSICQRLFHRPAIRMENLDEILNKMIEKVAPLVKDKNLSIARFIVIYRMIASLNRDQDEGIHKTYIDYFISKATQVDLDPGLRLEGLLNLTRHLMGLDGMGRKKNPHKALEVLCLIFNEKNDKNFTWNPIIAKWDQEGDRYKEKDIYTFSHCVNQEFPGMRNNHKIWMAYLLAGARVMTRYILKTQEIAKGLSPLLPKDILAYADAAIDEAASFSDETLRLTSLCSLARQLKDHDTQRALGALFHMFPLTKAEWETEEEPFKNMTLQEFDEKWDYKHLNEMTPDQQKYYLLAQAKILYRYIKLNENKIASSF